MSVSEKIKHWNVFTKPGLGPICLDGEYLGISDFGICWCRNAIQRKTYPDMHGDSQNTTPITYAQQTVIFTELKGLRSRPQSHLMLTQDMYRNFWKESDTNSSVSWVVNALKHRNKGRGHSQQLHMYVCYQACKWKPKWHIKFKFGTVVAHRNLTWNAILWPKGQRSR